MIFDSSSLADFELDALVRELYREVRESVFTSIGAGDSPLRGEAGVLLRLRWN
jgi:hypothetical protein